MFTDALIGRTGFVGGMLARQHTFLYQFNSTDVSSIAGRTFDTVICAAAPGSMFLANRDPQRDIQQINALIDNLKNVRASRFVLISSIAVMADFAGRDDEGSADFEGELAYGRNRRALEEFVESTFDCSLIVRLPALFGHGLKKNFIFDVLNPIPTLLSEDKLARILAILDPALSSVLRQLYGMDAVTGMMRLDRAALNAHPVLPSLEESAVMHGFAATEFHNPDTTYQYYNLNRLWSDICVALDAELSHIHLVTEPIKVAAIFRRLTGLEMPENGARVHHEDMWTRHANLWGKQGAYLDNAQTVLDELAVFASSARRVA